MPPGDRKVRLIIEVDDGQVESATAAMNKYGIAVKRAGDDGSAGFDKLTGSMTGAVAIGTAVGRVIGAFPQLFEQAIAGVVKLTDNFADQGIEIDKAKTITGLHAEALSALLMQTRRTGIGFNDLGEGIKSYIKLIGDANDGSKTAEGKMTQLLGQDWKAKSKNLDTALGDVFKRIVDLPDALQRDNAAMAAFGDQGARLVPFIESFHGNIGELIKKAKELGVVMSEDDVRASREYEQATKDFDEVLHSIAITLGKDYLPVLKEATVDTENWLTRNKGQISDWAQTTADLLSGLIVRWQQLKDTINGIGGAPGGKLEPPQNGLQDLIQRHPSALLVNPLIWGTYDWLTSAGRDKRVNNSIGNWSTPSDAEDPRYVQIDPSLAAGTAPPFFTGDKPKKEKKQHVLSPQAKAIIDTATQLGISPLDLATLMLYETAGTLSTSIRGGKDNNYLGLIQFGPQEQKQFGAYSGQSFDSQMQSVAKYLTARGVTPGASLLQLYEAVNGGHVGVSDNLSDGNGTISQHVERMMRDRMPAAKKMFEGFSFDSQSVQDDVARMLSQQSDQLTKEQRDKSVQTIIMIWKAFGLIPDGNVLNEIQRVAADDAKKKGIAQPTAGDIRDIFVQNALAKQGVIAAIPTQPTQVIGQHLMLGEQYTANLKQSFGLTPQYDEKGQNTFQDRYSQLIIRQSQLEEEIGVRLKDQEQSRQEQTTELEVQLKLLQRGDLIADSELRATERHVYLQSEIRDLRIEILNLGKDDADQIEIARLEKIIELRNRDRDAVIAIQDAQLELNRAMDISNVQIRAGVYEHIAGARSMSQAYADGINQTYDALTKLVTGPLDKLEQKTKGLLSFIIEPAKAYSEHAIGNLFTGIVDKLFPGMGDTLKKAQDPVHYYGDKQVDLLTKIEANTRRSASGAAGAAGIFGGGGGSSLDDLLGGILHADDSGSGQSHGSPGSAAGGVFGDSGIGSATGSGTLWDNLKGLFSTNKGGIFAPQRNVLTGKDSKLGGILGGAGSLATLAGGLIGGNFGSVLSDVGMGLQIGAMFGPIGAIVGAGVGLIAGLFGISSKRKEEEKARTQAMLDAQDSLKQLDDIIASVRRGADPNAAIAQATSLGQQVKQQYLQTVSQLTDKKTRNIAIADASRIDAIVTQKINELRQVAEQAGAAADRDKRILPEFASGVYMSPDFQAFRRYNGLIPGEYTGQDYRKALIGDGEAVLTPLQMQRARVAAGFDVFAEAGIPNYPNATSSAGFAAGGIASTGLGPQIVVRPEFTLYMEGVIFTDQANAWIESDDGVRQLVKVVNKQKSDGAIR